MAVLRVLSISRVRLLRLLLMRASDTVWAFRAMAPSPQFLTRSPNPRTAEKLLPAKASPTVVRVNPRVMSPAPTRPLSTPGAMFFNTSSAVANPLDCAKLSNACTPLTLPFPDPLSSLPAPCNS